MGPSTLPARPLLPGFFRVVAMGPDSVQLRSAGRVIRLAGPGMGELGAPLLAALDGRSTLAELAARFPLERESLEQLIRRLHHDGVLVDEGAGRATASNGNPATSEFLGVVGLPVAAAEAALSEARVLFAGLGAPARIAARHLAASGVGTLVLADPGKVTAMDQAILASAPLDTGRPRSWVVAGECLQAARVATRGAGRPTVVMEGGGTIGEILERSVPLGLVVAEVDESGEQAELVNAACLAAGVSALFHEVTTLEALIGPTVTPAGTACHECLVSRRVSHLRYYEEHLAYQRSLRSGELPARQPALLPGCAAMVGGVLSLEALGLLTGAPRSATTGGVLTADFRTLQIRRQTLLAVPGCPACGSSQLEVSVGR